jgi:hypothetical protein
MLSIIRASFHRFNLEIIACKLWGSQGAAAENLSLLGCEAAQEEWLTVGGMLDPQDEGAVISQSVKNALPSNTV